METFTKTVLKKNNVYVKLISESFGQFREVFVDNPIDATDVKNNGLTKTYMNGWKENGWKLVDLEIAVCESGPKEIE